MAARQRSSLIAHVVTLVASALFAIEIAVLVPFTYLYWQRLLELRRDELKRQANEELKRIEDMGGAVAAVDTGYLKQQLVESNTTRLEAIERGEQIVVGVNKYLESEPSPLAGAADAILTVSEDAERGQI